MFRPRWLTPGFLFCGLGLGLCLPLGGCDSSLPPTPAQTDEQLKAQMAEHKEVDAAFKAFQKAEKKKEKAVKRYFNAPAGR